MDIKLSTIIGQSFTILAAILVWMAHQWDVAGLGLNPWIALPLATLCMGIPYLYRGED